jgi:hypothetical protein
VWAPFTQYNDAQSEAGLQMWTDQGKYVSGAPSAGFNTTTATVKGIGPGQFFLVPSDQAPLSVVSWTAPASMKVNVTGMFGKGLDTFVDGHRTGQIDAVLLKNGVVMMRNRDQVEDCPFAYDTWVTEGDVLEFAVGGGTDVLARRYLNDATPLSVSISRQDNPTGQPYIKMSLSSSSITGGYALTGTVTISDVAPHGGALVKLRTTDGSVSTSSSVTIPEGATQKTFRVNTSPVPSDYAVTISGQNGTDRAIAVLVVKPPKVKGLLLSTSIVQGGQSIQATINLDGNAPVGGMTVTGSSDSAHAVMPAIFVPEGQRSVTVTINTSQPPVNVIALLTVSLNGVSVTRKLKITP